MQYIRNRQRAAAFLPCFQVPEHLCLIILCHDNLVAAQLLRRIFAEGFHDALNSCHPFQTLHRHGFHAIAVIAIFFIQLQQRFIQRHALFLIISRHFADQNCRINAILIPCISPCQAAVAFLKAEQIGMRAGFLKALNLLPDVFKPGQHINFPHAVCPANGCNHFCAYDGFHHHAVCGQSALLLSLRKNVVRCQCANHVACQRNEIALGILHHRTHTVTVGVCPNQHICVHLSRQLPRQCEHLRVLRIGVIHSRKRRIRQLLLLYDKYVFEACLCQIAAHRQIAGAMQGRINDIQLISHSCNHFGVHQLCLHVSVKRFVHFLTNEVIQLLLHSLCLFHPLNLSEVFYSVHLCDNSLISGRNHLCAVCPVYLIAVVFGRVMACRQHNPCRTAQLSHRKGKHGNGAQRGIYIRGNPVCRKNQPCHLRKFGRHETGIVCNRYALLLCAFLFDIICQSLRSLPNGIAVQSVAAVADNAAQTACPEFQLLKEPLLDFVFVCNASQLRFCFLVNKRILQPLLISYTIVFHSSFLLEFYLKPFRFFIPSLHGLPPFGTKSVCSAYSSDSRSFPASRYKSHRADLPASVLRRIPRR